MTNIADKLIDLLHRAIWFVEDARDGVTYRFYRTEALALCANAADKVEPLARKVSYLPGGWRPYLWLADRADSLHDIWVLSGRDWEHHVHDVRQSPDRVVGFFLVTDGPLTQAERRARADRECRESHR